MAETLLGHDLWSATERRSGVRRRALFAAVAAFGVLAVCALLVEAVLRVYAHTADGPLAATLRADPYDVLVEPHGDAGYRPRPDKTFRYDNGAEAHTNAAGCESQTSTPRL